MKILDTRDLNKRLDELEGMDELDTEEKEELKELKNLKEEVSEWRDGNQLIPENDFVRYCQDLCEEIGDLPKDLPAYIVVDWEKTSDNIRQDYSEIEYQGETYLYRQS